MRKTFCDICGEHIAEPRSEGYKLSIANWQNYIPEFEGHVQPPYVENLEMCRQCAQNFYVHIHVLRNRYGVK